MENKELKEFLHEVFTENVKLKEENKKISEHLKDVDRKGVELYREREKFSKENESMRKDLFEQSTHIHKMREETSGVVRERENFRNSCANLQAEVDTHKRVMSSQEVHIMRLEHELYELRKHDEIRNKTLAQYPDQQNACSPNAGPTGLTPITFFINPKDINKITGTI